jgi:alkylation response protein AidB-like acyl-CoA dehydrogenase
MIAQTCKDFLEMEVYPNVDIVDKQDRDLMKSMLKKSGELGLMGISIPEEYNGFGQSFVTQMLAAETIGAGYSFSVAFMAHCGIGTLPIMYYGTEEQRKCDQTSHGRLIGAYCNRAQQEATPMQNNARLDDGKYYILNGQKMWITMPALRWATVAKIDNDRVLMPLLYVLESPSIPMSIRWGWAHQRTNFLRMFSTRGNWEGASRIASAFTWDASNCANEAAKRLSTIP